MRTRAVLMATAAAVAITAPQTVSAQVVQPDEVITMSQWRYDDLYTGGSNSVEQFIDDVAVYGTDGEEIGDVENIIFGPDDRVISVVAEVGGFWDIGDTHVNIPWDQVELAPGGDGITVPVTQQNVEDYGFEPDQIVTAEEAATEVETVDDDLETGERAWRATELIGDYARLRDSEGEGQGYRNYGYVHDIIVRDGQIAAVVVQPNAGWGTRGFRAFPWYGYGVGWGPGRTYYDMPYGREDIGEMEAFDYGRFEPAD